MWPFSNNKDTWRLWQGFKTVTDYKPNLQTVYNEPSLPDNLNDIYTWFEATNNSGAQRVTSSPCDQVLQLFTDGVIPFFSQQ